MFWRLKANNANHEARTRFIEQYLDSVLAETLRADLAREAAQRGDWSAYAAWSVQLARKDQELQCYDLQAGLARGETVARLEVLPIYRTGSAGPPAARACSPGCSSWGC
ncbi:MAG: hypothetical protein ACUVQI_01845 [Thermochromatium sp.]